MQKDYDRELAEKYRTLNEAGRLDELMEQALTRAVCGDLEKHAYSVNDSVADAGLRNMHVLTAV